MQIGLKVENLDQLTALETTLRNVTQQARAAVAAIKDLNAVTGGGNAAPTNPATVPAGPAGVPSTTAPVSPTAPVTPSVVPAVPLPALPPPSKVVNWTTAVKKMSTELNKLAVAVALVATGVVVLISKAITATQQIANFGEATGLSTQRLQGFMHAAQVGGAEGKELIGLLDTLQSKQAAIALGEGDLSPFAFFGIDPNQDTNAVIDELRIKLKTFSKEQLGVAREMASRLGVGRDLFAAMRREAVGLNSAFILDDEAIESTRKLNAAWQDMTFKLAQLRNQLVSAVAPTFAMIVKVLTVLLTPIAVFVKWLNSGTAAANGTRAALAAFAVVLGVVAGVIVLAAAAVTALAVAMGLASAAATVLGAVLWSSGIAEVILIVSAVIAGLIALLVAVILIIDEFWTTITGGDSYLRRMGAAVVQFVSGPISSLMDAFGAVGDFINDTWDGIVDTIASGIAAITDLVPDWIKSLFGGDGATAVVNPLQSMTQAAASPPSNQGGRNTNSSQTNDVTINVDGSKDPQATAGAVDGALKRSFANAAYQMPVTSY